MTIIKSTKFSTQKIEKNTTGKITSSLKKITSFADLDIPKIIEKGVHHSLEFEVSFDYEIIFELDVRLGKDELEEWYKNNISNVSTEYCKVFAKSIHSWGWQ